MSASQGGIGGNFHLMVDIIGTAGRGGGDDGLQLGLLGGQLVKIGIRFGIGCIHLFQALARSEHIAQPFLDRLAHGMRRVQLRLLRQIAYLDARHGNGLAFDLLIDARHDLEQR
jgi:hypothetical protein